MSSCINTPLSNHFAGALSWLCCRAAAIRFSAGDLPSEQMLKASHEVTDFWVTHSLLGTLQSLHRAIEDGQLVGPPEDFDTVSANTSVYGGGTPEDRGLPGLLFF
ncbi:hypothetical protein [Cupriavidus agavae]|uniref:Uncharacterized protein n=1 Tax=Cupriavidus agavae TaxID=1001822 RepID=A0A4Q7S963_9BURK|nr:hypothetical protein [Cupriavidus agavae]RZT42497.1 hypothetical protein EV147_1533 [Cupriavidus agavae]